MHRCLVLLYMAWCLTCLLAPSRFVVARDDDDDANAVGESEACTQLGTDGDCLGEIQAVEENLTLDITQRDTGGTIEEDGDEDNDGEDDEDEEEEDGDEGEASKEEEDEEEDEDEDEEDYAECIDTAKDCSERALDDGCILNFLSMLEDCTATCYLCHSGTESGIVMNIYSIVPQDLHGDRNVAEYSRRVDEYMFETVYAKMAENVKRRCKNKDSLCTFLAHAGECNTNREFMLETCAPACMECENSLDYALLCPFEPDEPGIWEAGDLHQTFTNMVILPEYAEYRPVVLSRPISKTNPKFGEKDGPWIVLLDDFASEDECESLMALVDKEDFEVVQEADETEDAERSFSSHMCEDECADTEIIEEMELRMQFLTGIPAVNMEPVELLKYGKGDFYDIHSDYITKDFNRAQGPRILTVIVFLNDFPELENDKEGKEHRNGGILFEGLGATIRPKRGRAVIFPNVLNKLPMARDRRTQYEIVPLKEGTKYLAVLRLHQRDFKTPYEKECAW